jgi:hypothetical protein
VVVPGWFWVVAAIALLAVALAAVLFAVSWRQH